MPRPRSPLLSRTRIIDAALALIDAEGLAALSTRRLALELGVSGPSLYNHFPTKEDLLEAVADSVIAQVDLNAMTAAPWPQALGTWARSYHAALTAHPNLVPIAGHGPGRRPSALRMADTVYGALVMAGWPPREATRIGALMRFFVIGSALGSFAAGFVPDPEVYAADYPHLREAHLLAERRQSIDEGAFELGLTALIAGLRLQFSETTQSESSPKHINPTPEGSGGVSTV